MLALNPPLPTQDAGPTPPTPIISPTRILIVEDDVGLAQLMQRAMKPAGYEALLSTTAERGLELALQEKPALILLDVLMPGSDGFEIIRRLQRDERTRHIPIILVTALGGTDNVVRGLDLGAVDYVVKPFKVPELISRMRAALRWKTAHDELRRLNAELASLALVDSLTRLYNRRAFLDRLRQAMAYGARRREPVSCLLIDIDYFKQINDRYGHIQGDAALREVALVLQRAVRTSDTLGRFGGEEFGVICPACDSRAAALLGERLRSSVEAHDFAGPAGPLRLTISVGCATEIPERSDNGEKLLSRADDMLYAAKRAGRNSVRTDGR